MKIFKMPFETFAEIISMEHMDLQTPRPLMPNLKDKYACISFLKSNRLDYKIQPPEKRSVMMKS